MVYYVHSKGDTEMKATMYRIYAKHGNQIEMVDVAENDLQMVVDALIEAEIEPVKLVELVWSVRWNRYLHKPL